MMSPQENTGVQFALISDYNKASLQSQQNYDFKKMSKQLCCPKKSIKYTVKFDYYKYSGQFEAKTSDRYLVLLDIAQNAINKSIVSRIMPKKTKTTIIINMNAYE